MLVFVCEAKITYVTINFELECEYAYVCKCVHMLTSCFEHRLHLFDNIMCFSRSSRRPCGKIPS